MRPESPSPYARSAPNLQQTLDLFAGHWASQLPGELAGLKAGTAALFADPRVEWAVDGLARLGHPLAGKHVLELGPLEGGHTYLLAKAGAGAVTAIEAHGEAYLKCLVMKEVLGIERVNFLYGDATAYLRESQHVFDLCFASGFLYHMVNPVEVIENMCRRARAVYLWTVHWDRDFSAANPQVPAGSGPVVEAEHAGFRHRLHIHPYGSGYDYGTFWGAGTPHACWMERDEILGAFAHFGFTRQHAETLENPNGRVLQLVATRA